jgi:GAF domain-containing protein
MNQAPQRGEIRVDRADLELGSHVLLHAGADVGAAAVRVVDEHLGAGRAAILHRGGDGDVTTLAGEVVPVADGPAAWVLEHGFPAVSPDLEREDRWTDRRLVDLGVRAAVAVPVLVEQRPWAVLQVTFDRQREIPTGDVDFLRAVATVVAAAEERRRGERTLADSRRRLAGIAEALPAGVYVRDLGGRLPEAA